MPHVPQVIDLHAVDEKNSVSMIDRVDVVAIDRIFSSSAALGPEAIVHFVTNLCAVSREELSSPSDPQVYALQKLVEIAYYNMSRVRLVWARIWEVLGDFFTEVGQHTNPSIAMYAADAQRAPRTSPPRAVADLCLCPCASGTPSTPSDSCPPNSSSGASCYILPSSASF